MVVFLVMVVVSAINLVLALSRNANLVKEVNTVRKSYDRIAFHAKTRLLLRSLINIANGYEPTQSEVSRDRFAAYIVELGRQIGNLKSVQDHMD